MISDTASASLVPSLTAMVQAVDWLLISSFRVVLLGIFDGVVEDAP